MSDEQDDSKGVGTTPTVIRETTRATVVVVRRAGAAVETKRPEAPVSASEVRPVSARVEEPTEQAMVSGEPATVVASQEAGLPASTPEPAGPSVSDEVPESASFEEMFDEQVKAGGIPSRKSHPKVGDRVRAKIFQLGAEHAFVLVGRHEAMIALDELKDEEGILRLGVGDEVESSVVETGAHGVILSRKLPRGAVSMTLLAEAKKAKIPVDGLVLAVNKGGLEVAVGEVRAFCPASQVGVHQVNLDTLVGQRLQFAVREVSDRKVVLSRRVLLEAELKIKAAELRSTLAVGKVLKGTIVNVQSFGAFVDLGGIDALLPVSELAHQRVSHASDVVKVGDTVEVEIIRIDPAEPNSPDKARRRERIALSMRKLLADPFEQAAATLSVGAVVSGTVARLQPFGAFVELLPGVDGLVHISAMSARRIAHPRDVLKVGDAVEVKVEAIEPAEKRIKLRLVVDGTPVGERTAAPHDGAVVETEPQAPRPPKPRRGQIVTGKVSRIEPYGIFLEWDTAVGLIPAVETGTDRGTDLKRVFPLGKELKAEIIEINGEKLKLSLTAAARSEERADLTAWKSEQAKKTSSGGFNSLADKLRALKLQSE